MVMMVVLRRPHAPVDQAATCHVEEASEDTFWLIPCVCSAVTFAMGIIGAAAYLGMWIS